MEEEKKVERNCAWCGKIFESSKTNQKYCDKKCYYSANKLYSKGYNRFMREQKARKANDAAKKRTKKTHSALAVINEAARAAGMNYGEYVARMGL